MRIAVPVAQFHRGNTGEYVVNALEVLGIESKILSPSEFHQAFSAKEYDFYFCVDSGEAFPFSSINLNSEYSKRLAFWFIDYRHNKHRDTRVPSDFENAKHLSQSGAWIFQAQDEDVADCKANGITNCSWLPMAADIYVWSDEPKIEKKLDIGFVGNIWDSSRLKALQEIQKAGFSLAFRGHGLAWKEDGAAVLRNCKLGFNISSFYGSPVAYDLNMRFFETLSCGIPVVTNSVPSLSKVLAEDKPFVRTYSSLNDLISVCRSALSDNKFLNSGLDARKWIKDGQTYVHRMMEAISIMKKNSGQ